MDLTKFDTITQADQGAVVHLRHPGTDTPLYDEETNEPVSITVLGADSKKYTRLLRDLTTKRLNRKLGKRTKVTAEEIESDNLELAIEATVSWEHIVLDGEKLQCTLPNTRKLYTRLPWIREQVDEVVNERANYMGE